MNKKIIPIIIGAIIIPIAIYAISPLFINTSIDEMAIQTTKKSISGSFAGVGDGVHEAQGMVLATESTLRLEEFHSTNGPDLHVYLATDDKATEFVDLGKLKANNGNQNYEIPSGTDLTKYNTVLIWCKQFSVLFGSAALA